MDNVADTVSVALDMPQFNRLWQRQVSPLAAIAPSGVVPGLERLGEDLAEVGGALAHMALA